MGILSAFTAMLPAVYHGTSARASDDPTEYFLTCLHLLVNVGMACKDLVTSHKALVAARGVAIRRGRDERFARARGRRRSVRAELGGRAPAPARGARRGARGDDRVGRHFERRRDARRWSVKRRRRVARAREQE